MSLKSLMENHVLLPIARSCFTEDAEYLITSPGNKFWFKLCDSLEMQDLIMSQSEVESVISLGSFTIVCCWQLPGLLMRPFFSLASKLLQFSLKHFCWELNLKT